MAIPIYQVDAFASRPFEGNPAAVCLLEVPAPESWMQSVAAEMNLAETAFLVRSTDGFDLRWFTPIVEVDLCGHATLAAAHVLWESGRLPAAQTARFHSRSGLLTADLRDGRIVLDFPAEREKPAQCPEDLAGALGAPVVYTGRNRFDLLAEVGDAATLRNLQPDFRRLARIPARGVIVTCRSDDRVYDFLSRFFAPASGIDEDPVTGSAHCCLGPFWQARLHRQDLVGRQVSSRGGTVGVEMDGDRVRLLGGAVTVMAGELTAGY